MTRELADAKTLGQRKGQDACQIVNGSEPPPWVVLRPFSVPSPTGIELAVEPLKHVTIHADGSCLGNPGRGGYGVLLQFGTVEKELSGGFRKTTNNRMELMAAIKGLEAIKYPCLVTVYSDSKYLVDAMSKGWVQRWRSNGWMRTKKDRALNVDLWRKLLRAGKDHEVTFRWIRGHAGNAENERCDQLAVEAANQPNQPCDGGYAS